MNLSFFKTRSNHLICFCFFILVAAPAQGSDLCRYFIEHLGVEVGQTLTVYTPKSRLSKVLYGIGDQLVMRAQGKTLEIVTMRHTHTAHLPVVVRGLSVLPFGEIEEGMQVRPHLFAVEHTGGVRVYRFNGASHAILDSASVGNHVQLGVESFSASFLESVLTPILFKSTDENLNLRAIGMEFGFHRSSIEFLDNTRMDGPIHSIAMARNTRSPEVVGGANSSVVGVVDSRSISVFDLEGKSIAFIDSRLLGPARVKRILVAGKVPVDGENKPQMAFHVFTGDRLQTFALVRNVLRPVVDRQLKSRVESAAAGVAPGDLHYLMRDAAGQLHRVRLQVSDPLILEEQVFPVFDLFPPGNN
jgi:hypothetical protein